MTQFFNTCSSCSNVVNGVFQFSCPIIIHAQWSPKTEIPGPERDIGQQEEMVEAEKELYIW